MNKKKYIILIGSLILICVAMISIGTVANYTHESISRNVITSGGLDISIVEQRVVNDKLEPYPEDEVINVMPSNIISKIVTVKNSDEKAFIRAKYEIIVTNPQGESTDFDSDAIFVQGMNEKWSLKDTDDGWYYYTEVVDTDKSTEPLFEEVHFSGEKIGNEYADCTVNVKVYAEALQADNNGTHVFTAKGWSEK